MVVDQTRTPPGATPSRRVSGLGRGWRRLLRRHSAILFDVGTTGVRACQARSGGGEDPVRELLSVQVGGSLRVAGERQKNGAPEELKHEAAIEPDGNELRATIERLARLVGQGRFVGSDVGLVLPAAAVRFHTLMVSEGGLRQPAESIQQALKWEIAREERSEPHDIEVRFWRLPRSPHARHNVMAVALSAEQARGWHGSFGEAGLRLSRLTIAPCALVWLALRGWPAAAGELWGALDLGARQATLSVVIGDVPIYVRGLSASAESWTQRLSEGLDVSPAEAEKLKRQHGVRAEASSAAEGEESLARVNYRLLRDRLEVLAQEIERCFSYVLGQYPDANPVRLALAGGGAQMPGLAEFLSARLGLPASVVAGVGGVDFGAEAASAVGGALLDVEGP
ncbi:MAG: pilus assembly protein PilM [Phycisphaerae bacterium]|nr:pilus assembly protein PilM [Phycisphaerae bacterium]MCZ2398311.1 pilus assembly protein PilM [Phycisphaerae bacterium]